MTPRSVNLWLALAATGSGTGCTGLFTVTPAGSTGASEAASAAGIMAALPESPGDSVTLAVSVPAGADGAVLCRGALAACTLQNSGALQLTLVRAAGDLKIMKTPQPLMLAANEVMTVSTTGAVPVSQKLRFEAKAGGQPPGGAAGAALITEPELTANLKTLASAEFKGRGSGDQGNEASARWIADRFKEYGLQPGVNGGYLQEFRVSRGNGKTANVIGVLPGTDPQLASEVVLIGGHQDHLGSSGSGIYYGADDNGTGTIAVLAVAKAMASVRSQLKRTCVFVAWSGEEIGLLGSKHYVSAPVFPMAKHVYAINVDMIGYSRNGSVQALGGGTSAIAKGIMQELLKAESGLKMQISSSAGGGSDHAPFMAKGVPGVFFHTGLHEHYHRVTDTIEKINYADFTRITRFAFQLMERVQAHPEIGRASGAPEESAGLSLAGYERPSLIDDDWIFQYDHGEYRFDVDGELETMRAP